jgi:hypothetical protein
MVNALMVTDALSKAFEAFHLDARNEDDWRQLAGILAEKQFGKRPKKKGRPRTIGEREYQLALDAYAIEKVNKGKRFTSRKLAKLIYDKFPNNYERRPATQEPWHEIYIQILAMKRKYEKK